MNKTDILEGNEAWWWLNVYLQLLPVISALCVVKLDTP